ncbi:hypothetical protein ACJX0J_021328, partial [Zea mays]
LSYSVLCSCCLMFGQIFLFILYVHQILYMALIGDTQMKRTCISEVARRLVCYFNLVLWIFLPCICINVTRNKTETCNILIIFATAMVYERQKEKKDILCSRGIHVFYFTFVITIHSLTEQYMPHDSIIGSQDGGSSFFTSKDMKHINVAHLSWHNSASNTDTGLADTTDCMFI